MGPLFREGLFGALGLVVLVYVVLGFLFPFVLIYVLGYLRRSGSSHSDPMLGAKVFLTLLMSVSFQIVVFATYRFIAIAIGSEDKPSDSLVGGARSDDLSPYRVPFGILMGGLMAAVYPSTLDAGIRHRESGPDAVWRSAIGVNAIFTGLVFVIAVTVLTTMWALAAEDLSELYALTFVYLTASFGCALSLSQTPGIPKVHMTTAESESNTTDESHPGPSEERPASGWDHPLSGRQTSEEGEQTARRRLPEDACLSCGQLIPSDADKCPACGWTWGGDDTARG